MSPATDRNAPHPDRTGSQPDPNDSHPDRPSAAPPACLVIDQGGRWSDVYRLHRGQTAVLGRSSDCDIVVRTEGVSRRHSEVYFDPSSGAWMVKDLGSRNGTFLDGKAVSQPTKLSGGQFIQIVGFAVQFSDQTDVQTPPDRSANRSGDGTDNQATICLEPSQIQTQIEHSGWIRGGDDPSMRASPSKQSRDDKESKSRAALLKFSFELAQQSDLNTTLKSTLAFLCRTAGPHATVSIVPGELIVPGKLTVSGNATTSDQIIGFGGAEVLALIAGRSGGKQSGGKQSPDHRATLARNILAQPRPLRRDGAESPGLQTESSAASDSQNSMSDFGIDCAIVAPILLSSTDRTKLDRQKTVEPKTVQQKIWGHLVVTTSDTATPLDGDDLRNVVAAGEILSVRLEGLAKTRTLAKTLERSRQQVRWLRETLGDRVEIIGQSESMSIIVDQIRKVASTPSTVLIRGESGVGKELVASAIHHASDRRDGPLVCLNCAAISPTLLESELFGHEQGAFTGAEARRRGKFEAAHRGTILLDEIGEMSAETQTKFLRVLENRSIERVGGQESIAVDVRVIAATHRDLRSMVDAGEFRQDLYYRLHVIELTVPPLRDRGDDVILLAQHFLKQFARQMGRPIAGIDDAAAKRLRQYHWPGNIRELRNAIERAVVLSDRDTLLESDLLLTPAGTSPSRLASITSDQAGSDFGIPVDISLAELERRHIDRVLSYTENNKTRAASILGIERSTLDRKLKRRQK